MPRVRKLSQSLAPTLVVAGSDSEIRPSTRMGRSTPLAVARGANVKVDRFVCPTRPTRPDLFRRRGVTDYGFADLSSCGFAAFLLSVGSPLRGVRVYFA